MIYISPHIQEISTVSAIPQQTAQIDGDFAKILEDAIKAGENTGPNAEAARRANPPAEAPEAPVSPAQAGIPAGFAAEAGSTAEAGFPAEAGIPAEAGFAAEAGFPAEAGIPVQAGIPAEADFAAKAGFAAKVGSAAKAGNASPAEKQPRELQAGEDERMEEAGLPYLEASALLGQELAIQAAQDAADSLAQSPADAAKKLKGNEIPVHMQEARELPPVEATQLPQPEPLPMAVREGKPLSKEGSETTLSLLEQIGGTNLPSELNIPGNLKLPKKEEPEEAEKLGKADEKGGKDRKAARFTLEAVDLRTRGLEGPEKPGSIPRHAGLNELELQVELRSSGARTAGELSEASEQRPIQSFQEMLARELHENLNGDIVRHASVILRDGGEGTIRLSLKPETLGNIKIRLEMTENKITGRIIVESADALKAFEQEIHGLEQAFQDSGFEGASFEMALNAGASDGNPEGQDGPVPFFSEGLAASSYDGLLEEDFIQWADGAPSIINMLV